MASTARRSAAAAAGEIAAEGHLVLEGQMDHAVRVGSRLGQAVGLVEVAPPHHDARRFQLLRRCAGAREADHFMAGFQ